MIFSIVNVAFFGAGPGAAAGRGITLTVMLIIALIGMPLVLLYTSGVYYFFRGKVVVEPKSY